MTKWNGQKYNNITGATKWEPATCQCIIIFDKNKLYLADIQKCQIHKHLDGQLLLDAVITHNTGFKSVNYDASSTLPAGLEDIDLDIIETNAKISNDTTLLTTVQNRKQKIKDSIDAQKAEKDRIEKIGNPVVSK